MTTLGQVRKIALALPEATEQDHHSMISFRVRGKIFATVPDDGHLRVMVDEMEIRAAVAANPDVCQELYWGKRLAAVEVDLKRARPLFSAWSGPPCGLSGEQPGRSWSQGPSRGPRATRSSLTSHRRSCAMERMAS